MAASNPIDFATLKVILPFIKDAVLLRGPHGIGKSAVPAGVSKTSGKRLLDVRLSLFTEGDLVGVPDHERIKSTGVTSFAPPDWLHAACNEPVVLFLDEINRATPGVQNSAFQLVLDREVKGWRLHPETRVFAAINDSPEYNVNEMDPALLDRFVVYDLVPTHKDWLVWATAEGLDDLVVDFIRQHPEHLRPTKSVEPGSISLTLYSGLSLIAAKTRVSGWRRHPLTSRSRTSWKAEFWTPGVARLISSRKRTQASVQAVWSQSGGANEVTPVVLIRSWSGIPMRSPSVKRESRISRRRFPVRFATSAGTADLPMP